MKLYSKYTLKFIRPESTDCNNVFEGGKSFYPTTSFSPDLAPCEHFLFPKPKFDLSEKRHKSRNVIGSPIYQFLMGVFIGEYETNVFNPGLIVSNCVFRSRMSTLKYRVG